MIVCWRLRYVPDPTGVAAVTELYRNGKRVFGERGLPNIYEGDARPYRKMGIYKWAWLTGPGNVMHRAISFRPVVLSKKAARRPDDDCVRAGNTDLSNTHRARTDTAYATNEHGRFFPDRSGTRLRPQGRDNTITRPDTRCSFSHPVSAVNRSCCNGKSNPAFCAALTTASAIQRISSLPSSVVW